jgi:prevent-host-death family protein
MKFVSVREFRIKPGDIWKQLKVDKDIIITSNGKPIAILNSIEQDDLENSLITLRRARALLAMENIQKEAISKGLDKISEEEIEEEIKVMRQERNK